MEEPASQVETVPVSDDSAADAVEVDDTPASDPESPVVQETPVEQTAPTTSPTPETAEPVDDQKDEQRAEQPEKKGFFKRLFGR